VVGLFEVTANAAKTTIGNALELVEFKRDDQFQNHNVMESDARILERSEVAEN